MKRAYTKPELFCEDYELSVEIAGNCGRKFSNSVNHNDPKYCYYEMGDDIIFITSNSVCDGDALNAFDGTSFCYETNSYGENIIFAS